MIFGILYDSFGENGPLVAFGSGAALALAAAILLARLPKKPGDVQREVANRL